MNTSQIDVLIENVTNGNHLDALIRATEEYVFKKDYEFVMEIKERIHRQMKFDKKYIPTTEEQEVLDSIRKRDLFYKIDIKEIDIPKGTGYIFLYDNGATIFYSKNSSHFEQHFTIAHELGHILMHAERRIESKFKYKRKPTINSNQESEADEFAEKILRKLSSKLKDPGFLKNI